MTGTITFHLPGRPPKSYRYRSKEERWDMIQHYQVLCQDEFYYIILPDMRD